MRATLILCVGITALSLFCVLFFAAGPYWVIEATWMYCSTDCSVTSTAVELEPDMNVVVNVAYSDRWGNGHTGTYRQYFDLDQQRQAYQYVRDIRIVGHTYPCYYNSQNTSQVLWSLGYEPVASVFAVAMLFGLVVLGCMVICVDLFLKQVVADPFHSAMRCVEMAMWISIVLAFGVFLPLSQAPSLTVSQQQIFEVLMCQAIAVGALGFFVHYSREHVLKSAPWIALIFLVVWYTPIGILIPLHRVILGRDSELEIIYAMSLSVGAVLGSVCALSLVHCYLDRQARAVPVQQYPEGVPLASGPYQPNAARLSLLVPLMDD